MPSSDIGFVYVLTNPDFTEVKVGFTSRLVDDRIADFRTATPRKFTAALRLPTQNARVVEQRTHELLVRWRVAGTEYFRISADLACEYVRYAAVQVNGCHTWEPKVNYVGPQSRLFLPLRPGDHFVWMRYENILDQIATIQDIWQAHHFGDVLELHGTRSPKHVAGLSDTDPGGTRDPVPYLDRKGSAHNGAVIGRERLNPGDRLLWISVYGEAGKSLTRLFEVVDFCQVVCRTWNPQRGPGGFPLILNSMTTEPHPSSHKALRTALHLPFPRKKLSPDYESDLASAFGTDPPPPEHWLPQLKRPKGKRTK